MADRAKHTSGSAADPSVESLTALLVGVREQLRQAEAERMRVRQLLHDALPSLGMNQRSYARRALEDACELFGENPESWTDDTLAKRDETIAALRVERDAAVAFIERIVRVCDTVIGRIAEAGEPPHWWSGTQLDPVRLRDQAHIALAAASRSSTEGPQTDQGVGQKPSVVKPEEGARS